MEKLFLRRYIPDPIIPPKELPADKMAIALALSSLLDFVVAKYLSSGVLPRVFIV